MHKLIALFCVSLLIACSTTEFPLPGRTGSQGNEGSGDTHNSQNSLDWAGTYQALMPCADCEAILTTLTLSDDDTYEIKRLYVGQDNLLFDTSGFFTWSPDGRAINLDIGDAPDEYLVEEGRLVQQDMDGEPVTGTLEDRYVLYKVSDPDPLITPVSFPLVGTRWELTALRGEDLPAEQEQKPWFLLARDGTVTGFGGCNSFSGSYAQDDLRLRFTDLASTLMACLDPAMNDELLEVMREADNFTRSSNTLSLNRARMAPLAEFRATVP